MEESTHYVETRDANGWIVVPQPHEISKREKDDAMGAYLMMFAAWAVGLPLPLLNLIAALIYFFIVRKKSRFVAFHALQSLLSQVIITAVNVTTIVWLITILVTTMIFPTAFFIFLFFAIGVNITYFIISIIALVRAHKGNFYYMPFFGRLAFSSYYGPNSTDFSSIPTENIPPEGL
jgi:uncharacterized membrane protein